MFRRRYQRRRFGQRSVRRRGLRHSSWRRRFGAATKSYRRRFVRRSFRKRRYIKRRRSHRRKGSFAAKVIKATVPTRTAVAVYQQENVVPALGAAGVPCEYFCTELWNNAATKDDVVTVELFDMVHLARIFNLVSSGSAGSSGLAGAENSANMYSSMRQKLWVSGTLTQHIRNQATEPVRLTAYYCRPRQNVTFADNIQSPSLYWWLSTGFANNGLDPTFYNPTQNDAMNTDEYSPFHSLSFVRDFKITRVKKFTIQPGQTRHMQVSNRRGFITTPVHMFSLGATTTGAWESTNPKYQFCKQARFILYKMSANEGGYGAHQAAYSKLTQTTSPAVIMRSNFKYNFRSFYARWSPAYEITFSGIGTNPGVKPAIIVPDAAKTGVVDIAE